MEQRNSPSVMWIFPIIFLLALGLCAWGTRVIATHPEQHVLFAAGAVSVLGVAAAWVLAVRLHAANTERSSQLHALTTSLETKLQLLHAALNQVSEQQLISERAKAIAFRESEREALRRAIAEETSRKDWDAALILVNEMETVFGYKLEADRIRQEIAKQRATDVRSQVSDGMAAIDKFCRGEQWSLALREADRLMRAFPDDPLTQNLAKDVEIRRQNLKRQLLEAWNDAVSRHDVDGAIEILKQLDIYLTPTETDALQDTARQIFKDKLMQLGRQFAIAMKNHAWPDAVKLGEAIMAEFPNSRMAQEVREKITLLRERAAAPASVRTA